MTPAWAQACTVDGARGPTAPPPPPSRRGPGGWGSHRRRFAYPSRVTWTAGRGGGGEEDSIGVAPSVDWGGCWLVFRSPQSIHVLGDGSGTPPPNPSLLTTQTLRLISKPRIPDITLIVYPFAPTIKRRIIAPVNFAIGCDLAYKTYGHSWGGGRGKRNAPRTTNVPLKSVRGLR